MTDQNESKIEICEENVTEEWRKVPGYKYYEVSNMGRVRSIERYILCKNGVTKRFNATLIKLGTSAGYPSVGLYEDGIGKSVKVHILVARAFLGERPKGYEVRHKNGNRMDSRLSNLEYGTHGENILDNYRIYGYSHKTQKLSIDDARDIKIRLCFGVKQVELAREYNVSKTTINAIRKGRSYVWLEV